MRYLILKPSEPVDPRTLTPVSLAALHEYMPPVFECASEKECAQHLRAMSTGSVGMPVPIQIGSGRSFLLGFVADGALAVDPDGVIPFVLFVQAVADTDADRATIKKAGAGLFDRKLWKVPVSRPELGQAHEVEIRASDAEVPVYTTATVGFCDGKLTIYAEAAGVELSISFDDHRLRLFTIQSSPEGAAAGAGVAQVFHITGR